MSWIGTSKLAASAEKSMDEVGGGGVFSALSDTVEPISASSMKSVRVALSAPELRLSLL